MAQQIRPRNFNEEVAEFLESAKTADPKPNTNLDPPAKEQEASGEGEGEASGEAEGAGSLWNAACSIVGLGTSAKN